MTEPVRVPNDGELCTPIELPPLTAQSLAQDYDAIDAQMESAVDFDALQAAIECWDQQRRRLETRYVFVNLRFRQNTRDEAARAAREHYDALEPKITARDVAIKQRLLNHERRRELEERFGAQAFRLWEADLKTYAPKLDDKLVLESRLQAEYSRLFGSIAVDFEGRRMTLEELRGYANSPDRALRESAERTRWDAIAERGPELDRLYAELVAVRDEIGRGLGSDNFTPTGYARMHRSGYEAPDVKEWRDAVAQDVVPLVSSFLERTGSRRGYRMMAWDESVLIGAETAPTLSAEALVEQLPEIAGAIDSRLGDFAAFMRDRRLLDVLPREGKGPGGFCASFPTEGYPFIFASFNGSKDDVTLLFHEMGHAFQSHLSRSLPLHDYLHATPEACEIHSIGLEFFAWPVFERLFGRNADAVRAEHLVQRLALICSGCAGDHFQHLVYARPKATPDERRAMWLEVQQRYMPWRDYGEIDYPARGNVWQQVLHYYIYPFYLIDYTLAACCALQFWAQAQSDRREAFERYVALCGRGGSGSFRELVAFAGLESPFNRNVLKSVAKTAETYLKNAGL